MPHPDAIQSVPADAPPGWSENMVLAVHDGDVSVWAHWGRMPAAPHVWETVVAVICPEQVLFSRSFGPEPGFTPLEPGARWHARFDGMARPTSEAELRAGPLADGDVLPLQVDLTFEAVHPMHGGVTKHQTWATAHVDQGGRVTGTAAGHRIDGFGFRDHSYGPRDTSKLIGDTWCAAVFPSGRALLGFEVWQDGAPPHATGFLFDRTEMRTVGCTGVPPLEALDGTPRRFTMELGGERVEVEQLASLTLTFGRPAGLIGGASFADPDCPLITEGPARITWDGETTDGWIEKSHRLRRPST